MVVSALESGSDEFLAHLFQEGQLISWLTSAPEAITPKSHPNDDRAGAVLAFRIRVRLTFAQGQDAQIAPERCLGKCDPLAATTPDTRRRSRRRMPGPIGAVAETAGFHWVSLVLPSTGCHKSHLFHRCHAVAGERKPLRAGYMGHVSALANKMGEVGTRRPAVAEALRGSRAWQDWLKRVLRPRNELENVMRWACGRPSAVDLAGADSDENELAVRRPRPASDQARDLWQGTFCLIRRAL